VKLIARNVEICVQTTVGDILGIGQEGISRIEHRSDLLLSTLRSYVEAMGGKLSLIVEFPDRKPVSLRGIGLVETSQSLSGSRKQTLESRRSRMQRGTRLELATMKA
jgi:hypothetical protein